jgi:predicted PurR-regulated permease PerM
MPEKRKSETISARGTLRTVLITLGFACIAFIALYLLRSFASALLLIFAGILFDVFLDAVTKLVMKWCRLRRGLALTLVVLLGLTVCVVFGSPAGPQVVQQAQVLIQGLPQSLALMQKQIEQYQWGRAILGSLPSFGEFQLSLASGVGSVTQALAIIAEVAGVILFVFLSGSISRPRPSCT